MKKTILFIALVLMALTICPSITTVSALDDNTESLGDLGYIQLLADEKDSPSYEESVIAILLNPHIEKAITDYYGRFKQYALYDARVDSITKPDSFFRYKVVISVETFEGPHNPPYGLETMTFTVSPIGIKMDSYVHKDI